MKCLGRMQGAKHCSRWDRLTDRAAAIKTSVSN